MYKNKRYTYIYKDWENKKNAATLLEDILNDPEFPDLEGIAAGCWGKAWERDSAQPLIDGIAAHKEKFAHIKSLFIGDMDQEDCEVSWIEQADYSKLWDAVPQLEKLIIKGSNGLKLGEIRHEKLRHLEIICGGLPKEVIQSVMNAKLPNLEKLLLYIGVEDYGFDGDISVIKQFLAQSDFPKLAYLGLANSQIQDDIAKAAVNCKYISQVTTLDLSMGNLTDEGGRTLLENLPRYPNIKGLNLSYHYMSEEMMGQLKDLSGIAVNVNDKQEAVIYDGAAYRYPMLTE